MTTPRLCSRCKHPADWHRHDDEACLSTHPQQDAAPEQTCRDHGPHLGFHWCPECYQRAFHAGQQAALASSQENT
jgi:hypothetical protein